MRSEDRYLGDRVKEVPTMLGWADDIERLTRDNATFRTVVFTGEHSQLTVMSLRPGQDIGWEQHADGDQFLRIEHGNARLDLGATKDAVDETHDLADDWATIVPAGTWHNVVNTGSDVLKLDALYAPPEHAPGTVHATKADDVGH
jgi:mannose-6-phosphate isomerase-like protein (cupin superfamily)